MRSGVHMQVAALPPEELCGFCTFLFRLARTPKPLHRLIAVEVASCLLMELPAPFAIGSGYKVWAGAPLATCAHMRGRDAGPGPQRAHLGILCVHASMQTRIEEVGAQYRHFGC